MVIMLRCVSLFQSDAAQHMTEVYRCPSSVRYEYRLRPQNPLEYAILRHYDTLPRDDRMEVEKKAVTKKRVAKRKKKR